MEAFFRYLTLGGNRRREAGLTIVEVMIALGLLMVVTVFTTVTITNMTASSDRFNQTVQKESSLLNATSLISRDVTLATQFTYAGPNAVAMKTMDSGVESYVSHFHWTGNSNSVPAGLLSTSTKPGVDITKLPSKSGIVEYRIIDTDRANPIVRLTLDNYNPPAGNNIFTYFDGADAQVAMTGSPAQVPAANLKSVRRVEMHFASKVDGSRTNAMEMRTSAVPRLIASTNTNAPNQGSGNSAFGLAAPGLNGSLKARTNQAELWWPGVSGADSYEVFHRQGDHMAWQRIATVNAQEGVVRYTHKDLAWGTDNSYRVVAYNHTGPSDDSNVLTMRVTPETTQFDRIDPKHGLNGEDWSQHTVARGLVNNLYWTNVRPVELGAAQVSYKLSAVKNNVALPNFAPRTSNTFRHEPMSYGDVTRYVVTSSNAILTHRNADGSTGQTGGDAAPSNPVTLYSPPTTPVVQVKAFNDLVAPHTITTPENHVSVDPNRSGPLSSSTGIKYYTNTANSTSGAAVLTPTPITSGGNYTYRDNLSTRSNKGWGSTAYYFATASNDAGESPLSSSVSALQHPGPFNVTNLDNPNAYLNQSFEISTTSNTASNGVFLDAPQGPGSITGRFEGSPGATAYSWTRDIVSVPGKTYLRSAVLDRGKSTQRTVSMDSDSTQDLPASARSFSVEGASPGAVYDIKVFAKSANGLQRQAGVIGSAQKPSLLLTQPSIARHGYAELMCYADGTYNPPGFVGNRQTLGSYVNANTIPKYGFGDQATTQIYVENADGTRIRATDPRTNTSFNTDENNPQKRNSVVSSELFVPVKLNLKDSSYAKMNTSITSTQQTAIRNSLNNMGYANYQLYSPASGLTSPTVTVRQSQSTAFYDMPCMEADGAPGFISGPAAGNNGTNVWHMNNGTKTKFATAAAVNGTPTPWIVSPSICYGYNAGVQYRDMWVMPEQSFDIGNGRRTTTRAYTDAQKNALGLASSRFVKASQYYAQFDTSQSMYVNGCRWRLDPINGQEPYWETLD